MNKARALVISDIGNALFGCVVVVCASLTKNYWLLFLLLMMQIPDAIKEL